MKNIAIYGAGGFGREVACLIKALNSQSPQWNLIGFFDDGKEVGYATEYGKVVGGIDVLNSWESPLSVVLAIGTPKISHTIANNILNKNIDFPNIIAPDCLFFDKNNMTIGQGNIIGFGCCISCNVHLGNFNILNGYITIGHDARLGSYNSLMPAVRISGFDEIDNLNYFGVSSVVLQQIKIENEVTLAANSVLMGNPKNGKTYIGNPAKPIF